MWDRRCSVLYIIYTSHVSILYVCMWCGYHVSTLPCILLSCVSADQHDVPACRSDYLPLWGKWLIHTSILCLVGILFQCHIVGTPTLMQHDLCVCKSLISAASTLCSDSLRHRYYNGWYTCIIAIYIFIPPCVYNYYPPPPFWSTKSVNYSFSGTMLTITFLF